MFCCGCMVWLVCSDVYVCVPVIQACSGCVAIDPGGVSCGVSCFDLSCCVMLCFVVFRFLCCVMLHNVAFLRDLVWCVPPWCDSVVIWCVMVCYVVLWWSKCNCVCACVSLCKRCCHVAWRWRRRRRGGGGGGSGGGGGGGWRRRWRQWAVAVAAAAAVGQWAMGKRVTANWQM